MSAESATAATARATAEAANMEQITTLEGRLLQVQEEASASVGEAQGMLEAWQAEAEGTLEAGAYTRSHFRST